MKNFDKCNIRLSDKRISVCERNKKFTIVNEQQLEVIKVRVDGCLIDGEGLERCDYLFLVQGDASEIVYVELKGMDVPKAVDQLEASLRHCTELNGQRKKFCYVVCRRCPIASPELQVKKRNFLDKHKAILRVKAAAAEHAIKLYE